ncbi:MAG: exonuclease SbcCD subunit D, partial [Chloroflexota bacterium]
MSEPIRVLHFADVHIGMENYGTTDTSTGLSTRVLDFLRRMDEMIAIAEERDVDLVIFAGDAFKTRRPDPTYVREFAFRIQDLATLAPVVMLVGNHDFPMNQARANSIEIFDTLRVPNVTVAPDYELHIIDTKRGPVAVGAAPYPIQSWILEGHNTNGMGIREVDATLQEVLADKIEAITTAADEQDMPRLLTGHFTVSGAVVGSERNIMLGRDVAISLSMLADPRWDYVALGHIHKHQDLSKGREDVPPVVYSGSMERIDFGEEGDPKGFCWIELERNATRWEYVALSARPFVTIRMDLRESENPVQDLTRWIQSLDLRDAVVRVVLDLTREGETQLSAAEMSIRRLLRDKEAFYIAGVSKQVEEPVRVRLGGSPEEMTPMELLEKFFITK